jgi:hypothetical protein
VHVRENFKLKCTRLSQLLFYIKENRRMENIINNFVDSAEEK